MSNDEPALADSPTTSVPRRVTSVLFALTEREDGLSVRSVAEATGTSRSAAHRILQALANEGYAEQHDQGTYVVGPKFLQLAARVFGIVPIIRVADAIMVRLVKEVGETSYLAAYSPEDGNATYIHRVESAELVRHVQPLGVRLPLHAGAIGKAILAEAHRRPGQELELTRYTHSTHTTVASLEKDLVLIRERGYALSMEERVSGVAGAAAALRSGDFVVGGLTVGVPMSRIPAGGLESIGEVVKRYANELSASLTALGIKRF